MSAERFKNQAAVFTGGADGIGKAIARRLADKGAKVTIFDLNETSISATVAGFAGAGGSFHGEIVNVAEDMDLIAGFEAVAARSSGGPLDIMINCAAIVGPTNRKITDVSTAEFDLETAINLRGTVLIAKHSIVARGRGDEGTRGRGDEGRGTRDEGRGTSSQFRLHRRNGS
jgi:3-oxoacyl-[acyl-carrier protein] reductase